MKSNLSGPPRVLLVGDVMRDIIVKPDGDMRKGTDTSATIEIKSGGAAANQAVWLGAAGIGARLIGRVARKDREELAARFAEYNVEAHLAVDPDKQTGALVSLIHPDGERSFFTDRGANKNLCLGDVPPDALAKVDLLMLSGYSFFARELRKVVRQLMQQAQKNNIPVAIDPASAGFLSDVGAKNFLDWSKGAEIFFPNEDEAQLLSGLSAPEEQIRALGKIFGLVVIKRGPRGAMAGTGDGEMVLVGSPQVEVVDTTGAGDAFAAGFLARYLRGEPLLSSLNGGVEAGARAVQHLGGQPCN